MTIQVIGLHKLNITDYISKRNQNQRLIQTRVKVIWQKTEIARTPFWVKGDNFRGTAMAPFEERLWFPIGYTLLFGCNLPSNVADAQINMRWSLCGISCGNNLWRKRLVGVSQILTRSGREKGLLEGLAKDLVSITSAVWAQCTNVSDKQTNRSRNGNIDRNRRNR